MHISLVALATFSILKLTLSLKLNLQSQTGQACANTNFCGDGYCCKYSAACFCSHENCKEHCQHGDIIMNPPPANKLFLAAQGLSYTKMSFEAPPAITKVEEFMLQKSASRQGLNGGDKQVSRPKNYKNSKKSNRHTQIKGKEISKIDNDNEIINSGNSINLPKQADSQENNTKIEFLMKAITSLNNTVMTLTKALNSKNKININQSNNLINSIDDDDFELASRKKLKMKVFMRNKSLNKHKNTFQNIRRLKMIPRRNQFHQFSSSFQRNLENKKALNMNKRRFLTFSKYSNLHQPKKENISYKLIKQKFSKTQ